MSIYRYTLTTISPVHIGNGAKMTPLEYHLADELIVPDIDGIFAANPAAAEKFAQQLSKIAARDLVKTPLSKLIDGELLEDPRFCRYKMPGISYKEANYNALDRLDDEAARDQGDVRLATKTPDDRVYIPGSSLKGALKTAWAYQQLADAPQDARVIEAIARAASDPNRNADRQADREIQQRVFQSPSERQDAAFDLFRVVEMGDSEPRSASDTLILAGERVLSAGVRPGNEADAAATFKDYWVFCEAIEVGMEFEGRLVFNDKLLTDERANQRLNWSPAQRKLTVENLRAAVNRFAADLCELELEYFNRVEQAAGRCHTEDARIFYEDLRDNIAASAPETWYFSVGHGSGWHKLTIGLLLEKRLPAREFDILRRNLHLAAQHTDFEYPKSRKLVMLGKTRADSPFGWVKMTLART
jgi:CRISPR-associated protein Csm5